MTAVGASARSLTRLSGLVASPVVHILGGGAVGLSGLLLVISPDFPDPPIPSPTRHRSSAVVLFYGFACFELTTSSRTNRTAMAIGVLAYSVGTVAVMQPSGGRNGWPDAIR